ncbi:MAG: YitT family protein, partial [bacterium]|nr:YitT family protein [bacterium]
KIFFVADALVVAVSGLLFGDVNAALYAAISAITTSFVMDIVLYGRDEAKLLYIISACAERIAERLMEELSVGVTYINGQGAYSGDNKKVILCVVKKPVSPRAEEIVRQEDPESFTIVSSAAEVFGEGYKSYFSERV